MSHHERDDQRLDLSQLGVEDAWRLEVVVHGATARRKVSLMDGVALWEACCRKERTYQLGGQNRRARRVVLAVEVGGTVAARDVMLCLPADQGQGKGRDTLDSQSRLAVSCGVPL